MYQSRKINKILVKVMTVMAIVVFLFLFMINPRKIYAASADEIYAMLSSEAEYTTAFTDQNGITVLPDPSTKPADYNSGVKTSDNAHSYYIDNSGTCYEYTGSKYTKLKSDDDITACKEAYASAVNTAVSNGATKVTASVKTAVSEESAIGVMVLGDSSADGTYTYGDTADLVTGTVTWGKSNTLNKDAAETYSQSIIDKYTNKTSDTLKTVSKTVKNGNEQTTYIYQSDGSTLEKTTTYNANGDELSSVIKKYNSQGVFVCGENSDGQSIDEQGNVITGTTATTAVANTYDNISSSQSDSNSTRSIYVTNETQNTSSSSSGSQSSGLSDEEISAANSASSEYVTDELYEGTASFFSPLIALVDGIFEGFTGNLQSFYTPNITLSGGNSELTNGWNNAMGTIGSDGVFDRMFDIAAICGSAMATVIFLYSLFMSLFSQRLVNIKDNPLQLAGRYLITMLLLATGRSTVAWAQTPIQTVWNLVTTNQVTDQGLSLATLLEFNTGLSWCDSLINGLANLPIFDFAYWIELAIMLPLIKKFLKLCVEALERYLVLIVLMCMYPIAMAFVVTTDTSDVPKRYLKMYMTQLFLLASNAAFIGGFTILASNNVQGSLLGMLFMIAWCKTGQKVDSYLQSMGLSAAQTGGSCLDSLRDAGRNMMNMIRTGKEARGNVGNALQTTGKALGKENMVTAGRHVSGGMFGDRQGNSGVVTRAAARFAEGGSGAASATASAMQMTAAEREKFKSLSSMGEMGSRAKDPVGKDFAKKVAFAAMSNPTMDNQNAFRAMSDADQKAAVAAIAGGKIDEGQIAGNIDASNLRKGEMRFKTTDGATHSMSSNASKGNPVKGADADGIYMSTGISGMHQSPDSARGDVAGYEFKNATVSAADYAEASGYDADDFTLSESGDTTLAADGQGIDRITPMDGIDVFSNGDGDATNVVALGEEDAKGNKTLYSAHSGDDWNSYIGGQDINDDKFTSNLARATGDDIKSVDRTPFKSGGKTYQGSYVTKDGQKYGFNIKDTVSSAYDKTQGFKIANNNIYVDKRRGYRGQVEKSKPIATKKR